MFWVFWRQLFYLFLGILSRLNPLNLELEFIPQKIEPFSPKIDSLKTTLEATLKIKLGYGFKVISSSIFMGFQSIRYGNS